MKLNDEKHAAIAAEYRKQPVAKWARYAEIGRALKVDTRVVKRAVEVGSKDRAPIARVIADEQAAARAKLAKASLEERWSEVQEKLREQLVDERAQQGRVAQLARVTADQMLVTVLNAMPYVRRVVDNLRTADGSELTPREALRSIQAVATAAQKCVALAHEAVRVERLVLGEPERVVGVQQLQPASADLGQAEEVAEQLRRAVARAKEAQPAALPSPTTNGANGDGLSN
jgi:hypothetical protein